MSVQRLICLAGVVSALGFGLVMYGYSVARPTAEIWYIAPLSMRHVALLLMPFALVFIMASFLDGRIRRLLKHPLLIAVQLWALAHLLANGNSASVVVFGCFFIWALALHQNLRKRANSRPLPVLSIGWAGDFVAILLAVGLFYMLVFGVWHRALFGMPLVAQ